MADQVKSRTDLIRRALYELEKLSSGQHMEAEDSNTVDEMIDPLLRQLSADEIVDVNADEVDFVVFLPLARLLANEVGPSFGIPKNPQIQMMEERNLRRLVSTRPTYEVIKSNYF